MKLINENIFFNLENHLDMESFDALHDQINFAIAKNAKYIEPSYTHEKCLWGENHQGFAEQKDIHKKTHLMFDNSQLNLYTKLSGAITLGSHLIVRVQNQLSEDRHHHSTYFTKHLKNYTSNNVFASDFNFLFNWIDEQKCFTEFGRIIFWINEPNQKTALHTDYGNLSLNRQDSFIWITGKFKKKIIIKDHTTGEIHSSPYKAMIFNTVNWHGSQGDKEHSSWSLRIDGSFSPEWSEAAGLKNIKFFNPPQD